MFDKAWLKINTSNHLTLAITNRRKISERFKMVLRDVQNRIRFLTGQKFGLKKLKIAEKPQ